MYGLADDTNFNSCRRILSPWFPVECNAIEKCNLVAVSGLVGGSKTLFENERKQ